MKLISIVTPCYNEEGNVEELYNQIKKIMNENLSSYRYEHIFIDNASSDNTLQILKNLAGKDKNVKIIVNSRNFGWIRSPVHAMFQAKGDVVISIVADLQDPPDMIPEFISEWEKGNDIVLAVKKDSEENNFMFKVRKLYYGLLSRLSETKIYQNYTGFGLYSRRVIDSIREMNDPYPFFRGMIAEVGFKTVQLPYKQPRRTRGITKSNFYSLYDVAMLGIINNSKIPLRISVLLGVFFSIISALIGIGYFIAKLIYWNSMTMGIAPLLIMTSFIFSVILIFMGILGEYIGAIYTQVLNRPLVFEKERINMDDEEYEQ